VASLIYSDAFKNRSDEKKEDIAVFSSNSCLTIFLILFATLIRWPQRIRNKKEYASS